MKAQQSVPKSARGSAPKKPKTETITGKRSGNGDVGASGPSRISPAERRKLIERAAYYRAERRGFAPGGEQQDWAEAEAEVGRLLKSS